jgi:nucleotide-binding universal stress UspA family protein
MAARKTYVVGVDFSRTSEKALNRAIELARENKGQLLLVHVITDSTLMMPGHDAGAAAVLMDYYKVVERDAQQRLKKLARRKSLKPGAYRAVLIRGGDAARQIANQARKSRAAMIVMGSHGRTGLKRLMLGSVAERTLRYAQCPVMIVK